ncbi:MAG: hypothetical protein ACLP3K_10315 [Candidatus Acidiferrales bacterium]
MVRSTAGHQGRVAAVAARRMGEEGLGSELLSVLVMMMVSVMMPGVRKCWSR